MNANQSKGFSDDLAMTGDQGGALGVGDLGEDASLDPLAGTGHRKKFNGGSFVLVGVIVMALAGLFFMRTLSKVSASSGGKNSMEDKVKKFLDSRGNKNNSPDPAIVFDLGNTYTDRQVALTDVQRNPFILPGEGVLPPTQKDTSDKGAAKRLADRKAQFERAYAKLALKSIIMGSNPMASVNGRIVRRGDEITIDPEVVTFRITEITADSLSLFAEDTSFGLEMTYKLELKRDF